MRYNKAIMLEENVAKAAEQALKVKVKKVTRITKGEFNQVFLVNIKDKDSVVLRVFRNKNFPDTNNLLWIDKQLSQRNILHAKTLYCSRDNNLFPYGFMISEFVSGKNGDDAIKTGAVAFDLFHEKLLELLDRIHQIKIKEYGFINAGSGTNPNFLSFWLGKMKEAYEIKYKTIPNFDERLYLGAVSAVTRLLESSQKKFSPVLTHCDPGPDNCIWTENQQVVLVDWDTALANIWPYDLAILTYSGSHLSRFGTLEERQEKIRKDFFEHHKIINLAPQELRDVEHALHIIHAFSLLNYFYGLDNNERYLLTLQRLDSLLKNT